MIDKNVEWPLGWTGQTIAEQWQYKLVLHMDFFFLPCNFTSFDFELDN